MKILGLTYEEGAARMYLKPDSALLVGGKPFFLPHFSERIAMHPCLVVRICRLGRNIGWRFASRYYDAVALGMNMQAVDFLESAKVTGMPWTEAVAFDNSLAVGETMPVERLQEDARLAWTFDGVEVFGFRPMDMVCNIDEAVSRISSFVTVRMGDMVVVDFCTKARCLQKNEDIRGYVNGVEMMHCRIK